MERIFRDITLKSCLMVILGSLILAFGMYNIHSVADITEGGTLGLTLFLEHWFDISPAVSGFILNAICYAVGSGVLGRKFIVYSAVATSSFSVVYRVCEMFPPLWPGIYSHPLLASVLGAVFVGVGVGICVGIGGAPSGDDAIAMSISGRFKIKIQWVYLVSDLILLGMSLSYIPFRRIIFSLVTVVLSGQIIGYVQRLNFFKKIY